MCNLCSIKRLPVEQGDNIFTVSDCVITLIVLELEYQK